MSGPSGGTPSAAFPRAIAIIGVGALASALVDGWCAGPGAGPDIALSPRGAATSAALAARHPGVRVAPDNQSAVDGAELVLLSMRPGQLVEACASFRLRPRTVVVSAVAGASREVLAAALGDDVAIVRAIPLPGARQRAVPTVLYPSHPAAEALFDVLGGTVAAPDLATFDTLAAVTATISSLLGVVEATADWAALQGVPADVADAYVQAMAASTMAALAGEGAARGLAAAHETPGGLNEQVRESWLDDANRRALAAALDQVRARLAADA